ncbi:MAG TPA: MBL fold metallo-hydrolase [Clostridia bacterium]|nr:MBL fold metallo-hydrolase [Clostridia bacterium]
MFSTCDKAVVHIVDDAYVDMLSGNDPKVTRRGLDYHFHPASQPVWADGGICLVVDVYRAESRKRILIDGGYSSEIVLHNMALMGIDPSSIDVAVLSHGHPDHFGGLAGVLMAVGHTVPLYVHPDAFIPRSIIRPNGLSMDYINRELSVARLEAAGARVMPLTSPIQLAPGFMLTGQIERTEEFEREVPKGRMRVINGGLEPDDICDDMGFVCNIRDEGLVVVSMCGHSGIVGTIQHCRKLTGVEQVYGVLGGFHLGHPGVPREKITRTIEALGQMKVKVLAPIHCSGQITRTAAAELLPESFVAAGAATSIEF